MTVEELIAQRTAALTTALAAANTVKGGTASSSVSDLADDLATELAAANDAVSTKGGTVIAQNLSRLPMAITSIPSGSSDPHVIHYTPATRSGTVTLEHGLGYVPTMCACLCLDLTSGTTGKAKNIAACSPFGGSVLGRTVGYNNSGSMDSVNGGCNIQSATESSVTIGGGWSYDAGAEYIFVIS